MLVFRVSDTGEEYHVRIPGDPRVLDALQEAGFTEELLQQLADTTGIGFSNLNTMLTYENDSNGDLKVVGKISEFTLETVKLAASGELCRSLYSTINLHLAKLISNGDLKWDTYRIIEGWSRTIEFKSETDKDETLSKLMRGLVNCDIYSSGEEDPSSYLSGYDVKRALDTVLSTRTRAQLGIAVTLLEKEIDPFPYLEEILAEVPVDWILASKN